MAEDTSRDDPTGTEGDGDAAAPAPASEPEAPAATHDDAAEPAAEPAPAVSTALKSDESTEEETHEGLDPQLIVLCVLLWAGALGLFLFKWDGLKADWYLGNIMEAINLRGDFDGDAMDSLADMGPSVVPHLDAELSGTNYNRDELYRIAVVKVLEQIEGPEAQDSLLRAANDVDARVRANVYVSLQVRLETAPAEREATINLLLQAVNMEPEPVARSYAVRVLGDLDALDTVPVPQSCWAFIKSIREARDSAPMHLVLRQACLEALRTLTGLTDAELPYDPAGSPEDRDKGARAWEDWYVGKGGEIPDGESFADWEARLASESEEGGDDDANGDVETPGQRSE